MDPCGSDLKFNFFPGVIIPRPGSETGFPLLQLGNNVVDEAVEAVGGGGA